MDRWWFPLAMMVMVMGLQFSRGNTREAPKVTIALPVCLLALHSFNFISLYIRSSVAYRIA